MLIRATARFGVSAELSLTLASPSGAGGAGDGAWPLATPSINTDARSALVISVAFTALLKALRQPNDNSLISGQFPLS
jgi:hypothetical protein